MGVYVRPAAVAAHVAAIAMIGIVNQPAPTATNKDVLSSSAGFSPDVAKRLRALWDQQTVDGATSDVVYNALHEAIVMTILPAGQWLGEVQLARLFEVSRTPVREAILRLESDHLAVRIPRRGLVVSKITPQETIDVYVVREAIDGLAAALAAEMATPAEISNLEWVNQQFASAAEAGDLATLAETNLRFHEAVAAASHNALPITFVKHIHRLVRRFSSTTFAHPGRAAEAAAAHQSIIQAIGEHDTERARTIAMKDMAVARRIRVSMLQDEGESTIDAFASSES
jgi:DNA-binding GntR family transcriptional regulator